MHIMSLNITMKYVKFDPFVFATYKLHKVKWSCVLLSVQKNNLARNIPEHDY